MERIEIKLVNYDKAKEKIGKVFTWLGFAIILSSAFIATYWENDVLLTFPVVALLFIVIGQIISKKNHMVQQGWIIMDEIHTHIKTEKSEIKLVNNEFEIGYTDLTYKGQSNYSPPWLLGAFTTSDGLTFIRLKSKLKVHEFMVVINSHEQINHLKSLLSNFASCEKLKKPL